MKRKVVVLGFVLFLLLGISSSTLQKAYATGCQYSGCNGKDPVTMGCDGDAYTIKSNVASGPSGVIYGDIRFSPSCHASWARGISYSGWRYMKASLYLNGPVQEYPNGFFFYTTLVYTDMLNGAQKHCATAYMDAYKDPSYDTIVDVGCAKGY